MQRVDLFQQIVSDKPGASPIALKVLVPNLNSISEGVPFGGSYRGETYVLLSVLPEELRQRVILALQVLASGG